MALKENLTTAAICSVDVTLFLTVLLETNSLRMHWTDLHQISSIGTNTGGHDP